MKSKKSYYVSWLNYHPKFEKMEHENLIPVKEFCMYHQIDYSFLDSLQSSGLISVTSVQKQTFLPEDELLKVEKFIRLHYDLDINVEGLETISYLLEKLEKLQNELRELKNRSSGEVAF